MLDVLFKRLDSLDVFNKNIIIVTYYKKIIILVNDYYDNPKIMCVKKFKFLIGMLGRNVINLTTNLFLGISLNITQRRESTIVANAINRFSYPLHRVGLHV